MGSRPAAAVGWAVRVHIGGTGHVVEVPAGFDAAELRRLVAALC